MERAALLPSCATYRIKGDNNMAELVRDLMRHGAVTCLADTPVREVAQIMVMNRIRYVVVTDEKNAIAGIISARSILKAWGKDLDTATAKDILLPYTVTVTQDTLLTDAIKMMQRRRIQHLVVVSERPPQKRAVGILSASDIVRYMARI
jgi:CBS domain-containing protein